MPDEAPDLRPQHLDALQRANEIRTRRSVLKKAVAAGDLSIADVLRQTLPAPYGPADAAAAGSMTILDALLAVRRVGDTAARRILSAVDHGPIHEQKRVRDLTDRQRDAIVALIGQVAPWAVAA
jgi:hypothetical protein